MDFIVYAANLHAFNYGLKGETDRDYFRRELENVIVPEFKPKEGVKIQVQENETVEQDTSGGMSGAIYQSIAVFFLIFLEQILWIASLNNYLLHQAWLVSV